VGWGRKGGERRLLESKEVRGGEKEWGRMLVIYGEVGKGNVSRAGGKNEGGENFRGFQSLGKKRIGQRILSKKKEGESAR